MTDHATGRDDGRGTARPSGARGTRPSGAGGAPRRVGAQLRRSRCATTTALPVSLLLAALLLAAAVGLVAAPQARAASSLDAATIDAFLAAQGSPMTGCGATFVAEGAEHGVDPAFLVAVAGAESSFGLFLYSSNGDTATYNAFNWFYASAWPDADFGTWDEAIAAVAAGIAGDLYYGSGLYAVDEIGPRYCPDGTQNWLTNVALFMERLGGDPADTRWTGGSPPPTSDPTLGLQGRVRLSSPTRLVGDRVEARFTIVNGGASTVELREVRLAVRDARGRAHDLATTDVLVLAPGEAHGFTGSWSLGLPGRWHGWIEVRHGDQRVLLTSARAFAFTARLPRDPGLRRWVLTELQLSRRP